MNVQRSSKVSRRSPKRQNAIWTRPATESDRNNFSLPRTPNSSISRHRSDVSSNCCPKRRQRCLRFLWREHREQKIEVYEYTRHVFGAKSSSTCANYALHQVAKDNAVNDESLVKTVQQNFYMNDFLESARTLQEATEIYQKIRDILSKGGFKLTKWITSDEEVNLQIPQTDRSTKVVKTLEAEPQSSSILGLNWNVDTDSLIVCRGTE